MKVAPALQAKPAADAHANGGRNEAGPAGAATVPPTGQLPTAAALSATEVADGRRRSRRSSLAKYSIERFRLSNRNKISVLRDVKREQMLSSGRQTTERWWKQTIHPNSSFRRTWDMITALWVMYSIFIVPFDVAFGWWHMPADMSKFGKISDFWFCFDILLNFRTGYLCHGEVIMDPGKIAIHYLQGWFFVDLIGTFPFELFAPVYQSSSQRKSIKLVKYFKVPKLLRLGRVIKYFEQYMTLFHVTMAGLGILTIAHFATCIWVMTIKPCPEEVVDASPACQQPRVWDVYVEALHVTVCMLVGVSNLHFVLKQEHLSLMHKTHRSSATVNGVATAIFFIGVIAMCYFWAQVAQLIMEKHAASSWFRRKLDRSKHEMEYYAVPEELRLRVKAYHDYVWINQRIFDQKIALLNDNVMSLDLRRNLALHLYKDAVKHISLFSNAAVDEYLLARICLKLRTMIFLPNDIIIYKGDVGRDLYILLRGLVEIVHADIPVGYGSSGKAHAPDDDSNTGTSAGSPSKAPANPMTTPPVFDHPALRRHTMQSADTIATRMRRVRGSVSHAFTEAKRRLSVAPVAISHLGDNGHAASSGSVPHAILRGGRSRMNARTAADYRPNQQGGAPPSLGQMPANNPELGYSSSSSSVANRSRGPGSNATVSSMTSVGNASVPLANSPGLPNGGGPTHDGAGGAGASSHAPILLSSGAVFGEIGLLMEIRRTTNVRAVAVSEVSILDRDDFDSIMQESPEFAQHMKELVIERQLNSQQIIARNDEERFGTGGDGAAGPGRARLDSAATATESVASNPAPSETGVVGGSSSGAGEGGAPGLPGLGSPDPSAPPPEGVGTESPVSGSPAPSRSAGTPSRPSSAPRVPNAKMLQNFTAVVSSVMEQNIHRRQQLQAQQHQTVQNRENMISNIYDSLQRGSSSSGLIGMIEEGGAGEKKPLWTDTGTDGTETLPQVLEQRMQQMGRNSNEIMDRLSALADRARKRTAKRKAEEQAARERGEAAHHVAGANVGASTTASALNTPSDAHPAVDRDLHIPPTIEEGADESTRRSMTQQSYDSFSAGKPSADTQSQSNSMDNAEGQGSPNANV